MVIFLNESEIIFWNIVKCFQVFLCNTDISVSQLVSCLDFVAYQPLEVILRQILFYATIQFYFRNSV